MIIASDGKVSVTVSEAKDAWQRIVDLTTIRTTTFGRGSGKYRKLLTRRALESDCRTNTVLPQRTRLEQLRSGVSSVSLEGPQTDASV
jgi:hypothetical protein